jgi:3-oxoacyl-[acyl-carrier-protein] synthase-1
MSSPHPEGIGARLAMERALASAGLAPGDIDYLNLHGTATGVGDAVEDRAVFEIFGEATPCSSTKGQTGHTLGAAGIVEAIISLLAIRHGIIPANANTAEIDPTFRSRHLTTSVRTRLDRVMSNSFGFGGSNCSLVLGRAR